MMEGVWGILPQGVYDDLTAEFGKLPDCVLRDVDIEINPIVESSLKWLNNPNNWGDLL